MRQIVQETRRTRGWLAIARTSIPCAFVGSVRFLFANMLKDIPRWSSPNEKYTRPSDAKPEVGRVPIQG
eukprot:7547130-Pyramimonas_sp.AAC.1